MTTTVALAMTAEDGFHCPECGSNTPVRTMCANMHSIAHAVPGRALSYREASRQINELEGQLQATADILALLPQLADNLEVISVSGSYLDIAPLADSVSEFLDRQPALPAAIAEQLVELNSRLLSCMDIMCETDSEAVRNNFQRSVKRT